MFFVEIWRKIKFYKNFCIIFDIRALTLGILWVIIFLHKSAKSKNSMYLVCFLINVSVLFFSFVLSLTDSFYSLSVKICNQVINVIYDFAPIIRFIFHFIFLIKVLMCHKKKYVRLLYPYFLTDHLAYNVILF